MTMVGMNYISNGIWHIQKRRDLYAIYTLVMDFYRNALVPLYGETKRCRLVYTKDLNYIKVKYSGVQTKFLPLCIDDTVFQIKLLSDSIVAVGIANAPFYNIDISFDTNIQESDDICDRSKLKSSGGIGSLSGYYKLKGRIY